MRWEIIYRGTAFIAEEMGVALKRSSLSLNIRERMDYSCAVLDNKGRIVAQAEHIPVHLGSFRVGVNNLLNWLEQEKMDLNEGDMLMTNDPYLSGTHLNDIMILAPIFRHGGIEGYVVNKAHHVDVGGPNPGSINPTAKTLYEEGEIIPPTKIVTSGTIDKREVETVVSKFRASELSRGDLHAQVAANNLGIAHVRELFERFGISTTCEAWQKAIRYGKELTLIEIRKWPTGNYSAMDYLEWNDQLIPIRVSVDIEEKGVNVNFEGTSPQLESPINSVFGMTFSASAFAVRSLIGGSLPINEGFYSLLNVRAPLGSLVNSIKPAPVSGGNIETTQRVVDVMFKALSDAIPEKVPAAGSGTMMNVMMGGSKSDGTPWVYYETIGGGSGGTPRKSGVSGVHVNMTNTMNTPVEVAERVYPIFFTVYKIRKGSGGGGKHRGGDGIIRGFRVKSPTKLSILSDRFVEKPWGLNGGEPGKNGKVSIRKADGFIEEHTSKFTTDLAVGDEIVIETPGGGGWNPIQIHHKPEKRAI